MPSRSVSPLSTVRTLSRLIVLAGLATAGAAQAQSSLQLYGLIDLSAGRSQAPGGLATKQVMSGQMSTSYYGLKGTEDLGGGLAAVFAIESFMRNDTGTPGRFDGDVYWARSSYVGLKSGAGTLTLGRNTTSLFVNTLIFNAFGDSFGYSPSIRLTFTSRTATTRAGDLQVSGDTGWGDSVKYASPSFGGLSFTAHLAAGESNGGRNYGLSALYFGGPVGLGFAWQKAQKGVGAFNPDTTAWQLGGSLALGAAKLYAQYGHNDNTTYDNQMKLWSVGADYAIGQGKLLFQVGKLSPDVGSDRTTWSLGYDYNLSKRTDLYGVYMRDKISGLSTGANYGVGIRHRF